MIQRAALRDALGLIDSDADKAAAHIGIGAFYSGFGYGRSVSR